MKWFKYALAMTAVVLLLSATPLYAVNAVVDGIPVDYSLRVASQSGLESQLKYSFTPIGVNQWRVDWQWVNNANRLDLISYKSGVGSRPVWVQEDEVLAANAIPVVELSGGLKSSEAFIDETQASNNFVLTLAPGTTNGSIKVGLHSVVIEASAYSNALYSETARKLVDLNVCNGLALAYVNNSQVFLKTSVDYGATWSAGINISAGGTNEKYVSVATLSNHDFFVVYGDSNKNTIYAVNVSYDGGCAWTANAPINVTGGKVSAAYGDQMVVATTCSDDSIHLVYLRDTLLEYPTHKVCRVGDCSAAASWNASDSSAGYDLWSDDTHSSFSVTCDSSNNVYFWARNENVAGWDFYKLKNTAAGAWSKEYSTVNLFSSQQYLLSSVTNASDYLQVAYTNGTTILGVFYSQCAASTTNCSSAANWKMLNGSAGSERVNAFGKQGKNASIAFNSLGSFVFFVSNNTNANFDLVLVNTMSGVWSSEFALTSNAYGNTYASTISSASDTIPFAWINGTASPFQILFSTYGFGTVVITSPMNTSYLNSSVNASFSFTSNVITQANCTSYLNGVFVESSLVNNGSIQNHSLSLPTETSYALNVTCFNGSMSSSSLVYFSRIPYTVLLNVSCFDEVSGSAIVCDSVIVSNSTNSTMQSNAHSFSFSYPTGSVSIVASNASFYSRTYSAYFLSSNVSVNAYLLNASATAIFVRFHVSNAFSQPVNNASILLQRFIGGNNTVVSSLVTDSYGLASDYLELAHPYQVLVYAAGYNVYVSTISPIVNDYYISLVSVTNFTIPGFGSYELNNTFGDAYWNLEPNTHSLSNETTNIVFSVFSPGATLHYFGMQVDYANGTNVCFENVTNSSAGGVVSCVVYMDNTTYGTNVSVTVWIARSPPWVSDFIFWFKQTASTSVNTLSNFYQSMRTTAGNADSIAMAFIVIVVATIAGLWVYQYHKTGAMLVMLAILWLGAVEQFLNVNLLGFNVNGVYLMAFITVAVVSINFLRERV